MNEPTIGQLWALRESLESEGASLLGHALLAFSKLDAQLGLMSASILRCTGRESRVKDVDSMNFHKRAELLETFSLSPDIDVKARQAVVAWLREAAQVRLQRNDLVHGRWDVDPVRQRLLNTVGLPSSGELRTIEYSLQDLKAFVQRTTQLNLRLGRLRERWHLP